MIIIFLIGVFVGILIFGAGYLLFSKKNQAPLLLSQESPAAEKPMYTYTFINSNGDKEYIMSSKTMEELLSELNSKK